MKPFLLEKNGRWGRGKTEAPPMPLSQPDTIPCSALKIPYNCSMTAGKAIWVPEIQTWFCWKFRIYFCPKWWTQTYCSQAFQYELLFVSSIGLSWTNRLRALNLSSYRPSRALQVLCCAHATLVQISCFFHLARGAKAASFMQQGAD